MKYTWLQAPVRDVLLNVPLPQKKPKMPKINQKTYLLNYLKYGIKEEEDGRWLMYQKTQEENSKKKTLAITDTEK